MKWKLTPKGIRMVKEGVKKNIRNLETEDRKCLVAEDNNPPKQIAGAQKNLDRRIRDLNEIDASDRKNAEKNGHPLVSGVSADHPNQGKKNKRNAESLSQPSVGSEVIRDVENQLKNAILVAKERTLKKKLMDEPIDRQLDHGAGYDLSRGKAGIEPQWVLLLASDSVEAECFKLFQTLLYFPPDQKAGRAILITSAKPGEVLLVDCDLKSPVFSDLFGPGSLCGVSDYFARGVPISCKPHDTVTEGFSLWLGRRDPEKAMSCLFPSEPKRISAEWMDYFDDRTVILFFAPFSLPHEKPDEATLTEDVLFVIDYGVMPRKRSDELLERIGHDKILGCVATRKKNNIAYSAPKYTFSRYGRRV